jgi:hypothetical protein
VAAQEQVHERRRWRRSSNTTTRCRRTPTGALAATACVAGSRPRKQPGALGAWEQDMRTERGGLTECSQPVGIDTECG